MTVAHPGPERNPPRLSGRAGASRYELLLKIGAGGMASVYIGRASGIPGFSRLVAVKRAHPHLLRDRAVERMLITEAQLASSLHHANVVAVQDVERSEEELLLIMDYVEGASLAEILQVGIAEGRPIPARIAMRIVLDACAGLSAVHELEDENGQPLGFLHRDVSPQNILVGLDGTARISDFGLAKALTSADPSRTTSTLKGKLAYLSPEIINDGLFSVKSDIFAMGVVAWEALAKQRLFRAENDVDTIIKIGFWAPPPLSEVAPETGAYLDNVLKRALDKDPSRRYGTVRAFAAALEGAAKNADLIATSAEVSAYVRRLFGPALNLRRDQIRTMEREALAAAPSAPPVDPGAAAESPEASAHGAPDQAANRGQSPADPGAQMPAGAPARQWGGGAAILAVGAGAALAIGVFFAKPWAKHAGTTSPAAPSASIQAVTTVSPKSAGAPSASAGNKPVAPPASASSPDKGSAAKPPVINISDLPDKDGAGKPPVINVSDLPDKGSSGKPPVVNVSDLPDKGSSGKPRVIDISSLPDK